MFEGISKVFLGCFKEVLGVFRETFNGDSRELLVQMLFQGSFKDVLRNFQGC